MAKLVAPSTLRKYVTLMRELRVYSLDIPNLRLSIDIEAPSPELQPTEEPRPVIDDDMPVPTLPKYDTKA